MKILLLGATGRLGKQILRQILDRNFHVNVLVRDPNKIGLESHNMNILVGTPEKKQDIESAIEGCSVVINALNISRSSDFPWAKLKTPEKLISTVVESLVDIMPVLEISRIVSISAWGASETFSELPGWFAWVIKNSNVGISYKDHERQEKLLKKTDLDWTIVRPVGLTNSNKLRRILVSNEGVPKPKLTISRKQVARFVLDIVENEQYVQQCPTLSEK